MNALRSRGPIKDPHGVPSDSGYVLISLLWILALLAFAVSTMTVFTVNTLAVVTLGTDRLATSALVNAALETTSLDILRTASTLPVVGRTSLRNSSGEARVTWIGEAARIDLNAAAPSLLTNLFSASGAGQADVEAYVGAILQRRHRSNAGVSAGSSNIGTSARGQIAHFGELALMGIPDRELQQIRPYVTVYSGISSVDPRLAPPELLSMIPDLSEVRLREILSARSGDFGSLNTILQDAGESARFLTLERSHATRIHVEVSLANGYKSGTDIVIMSFVDDKEPFRILLWEETPINRTNGLESGG